MLLEVIAFDMLRRLHKRDDGAVAATKTTLKALKQGDKGTLGNLTPLLGDRKVEAMFGLMKPPAPRPPKQ